MSSRDKALRAAASRRQARNRKLADARMSDAMKTLQGWHLIYSMKNWVVVEIPEELQDRAEREDG